MIQILIAALLAFPSEDPRGDLNACGWLPGGTAVGDVNMSSYDIINPDDIYSTAMASDAAAMPSTVFSSKGPYRGIAATNDDGADINITPESGANNLTGVTKANTTGDTITFSGTLNTGAAFSVTLTEGDGTAGTYDCDGAASDTACVLNLYTLVAAHATLSTVVAGVTPSGETTAWFPVPGTSAYLKVTPSDGTNTVISRGTDGATWLNSPVVYLGTKAQGIKCDMSSDGVLALTDEAGADPTLRLNGTYKSYLTGTVLVMNEGVGQLSLSVASSNVTLSSNTKSTAAATGALNLYSGAQTNAGNYASGAMNLYTGATTTDGDTGDVSIYSGAAGAGAADAGDITIATNGAPGVGTTGIQVLGATGKVDTLAITQGDLTASCTLGQIALDTAGTAELCVCQATNTWYCIAVTDATGPAD